MKLLRRAPTDYLLDHPPSAPGGPRLDANAVTLLREGALAESRFLGAMRLRQVATGLATRADDRALAQVFCRRHTQWRGLLPTEKRSDVALFTGWFATSRLLEPGEPPHDAFISPQHCDAVKGFSMGIFVRAPGSGTQGVYELPPRKAPSLLRLVAQARRRTKLPPVSDGAGRR